MKYEAEDLWNKNSPYLEHKFGFKYILKLPVGKTFRYFYNQAEIAAYRAKKALSVIPKKINDAYQDQKTITANKYANKYEKKGEKNYSSKQLNSKGDLVHKSGVDEHGYKYVGKIEVDGKTRYFYSEEELEAYKRRQFYQSVEPEFMKEYPETNGPRTAEEDSISINTKYLGENNQPNIDPDYTTNCRECTFIYEMRRRGYDVEYNEKTNISGSDMNDDTVKYNTGVGFSYCFEKPKVDVFRRNPTGDSFKRYMKSQYPPNSRGALEVQWKTGNSGHSMVWETDRKGNVTIRDTQTSGSGMPATYEPNQLFKRTKSVYIVRMDNLKPKPTLKKIMQPKSNRDVPRAASLHLSDTGFSTTKYTQKDIQTKYTNII